MIYMNKKWYKIEKYAILRLNNNNKRKNINQW